MQFEVKYNFSMFAGVLLVCFFVSAGVRYKQLLTWEETPAAYYVGEQPLMTTLDAPYWIRWAREYNEGTYGTDVLRDFPNQSKHYKKQSIPTEFTDPNPSPSSSGTQKIKYSNVPLLSFLIAHFAPFFDYNYYLTGMLLIPFLASLFIFSLGFYFFRIGVPLAGLLGGLIGTFASGYYMRTSIGRIDTDLLNLFFPSLAALLILFASRATGGRSVLLYSVGAGLSLYLYYWWYYKPGFTFVYYAVLVFSLFINKIRFHLILLSSLLFLLCAHPQLYMSGTGQLKDSCPDTL